MNQPEYPMILGIDPSTTSMGLAFPDQSTRVIKPPSSVGTDVFRLEWLRDKVLEHLKRGQPQMVVLEDYVKGNKKFMAGTLTTGEWGGVLRLMLHDLGIPFALVNPATLRSFLGVGKGQDKASGISRMSARTGRSWGTTDEAEAWGLAAMAYEHYGHRWVNLPATQIAAVSRVEWPRLRPRQVASG